MRMIKRYLSTLVIALALACGSVGAVASEARPVVEAQVTVRAGSGYLELANPGDATKRFYVYSITGQLVKSVDVQGTMVVELPQGCYIVKCGSFSRKVVVK